MCIALKYGIWNVSNPDANAVNMLAGAGFAPLTAMILSARGMGDAAAVRKFLSCDSPLLDPFLLTDMDRAVARVKLAISQGEKI